MFVRIRIFLLKTKKISDKMDMLGNIFKKECSK